MKKGKHSIAKASLMISVFSVLSKLMGALRIMVINWQFGQGVETDAYNGAIRLTSISMNIIGTAIMTVLVPVLAHVKARHGDKGKHRFFNNISNMVALLALIIMAILYVGAPFFAGIMFPGFDQEKMALTVDLVRLGSPIIMALGLTNLASSYIHSYNIYGPYAMMGIPFNLVYFIYLFFFPLNIKGLMMAAVLAYFTQWLIQVPAIYSTGYRYRPRLDFKDPYIHRALSLVLPTAIGQAVQQINVIVDQNLASGLADGTITALENATMLNDSIIAIFITGLTTVLFPLLSEAFENRNEDRIVSLVDRGISFVFLITVPATIGIILLSEDIISLLFERNAFTARDTLITAGALSFYAIGLTANGLRHLFSKVYYSLNDTKTPMVNGMIAVAVNIVLNIILVGPLKHKGLALATSISITVSTLWMIARLKKRLTSMDFKFYVKEFTKVCLASVVMGFVIYWFNGILAGIGISKLVKLLLVIFLAMLSYGIMVILLKTKSSKVFIETMRERFKGKRR